MEIKKLLKKIGLTIVVLFFLWGVFAFAWFYKIGAIQISFDRQEIYWGNQNLKSQASKEGFAQESAYIHSHPNINFEETKSYFQDLANQKGARYAFDFLKIAPLPPNLDMHLLGHAVGDILYKQEGLDGITACTNDFRNACSHSIVTGLFYDKGENALSDIAQACRKAPGGSGAYTMCFHGLGHGILAFEGYDMNKASVMCKKTGTTEYNYQESSQCISGTVMEIISGGFHDKNLWQKQRDKTLDTKKPLALCMSANVPDNAKTLCYDYLTPFLWEAAGADIQNPTPQDFVKSFKFCSQIPIAQSQNRDACYGGFGKEFDGIVQARDTRIEAIAKISDDKHRQIFDWCQLADNRSGAMSCMKQAMGSLYWGGENEKSVAIRFCKLVPSQGDRGSCFTNLIGSAFYYVKDQNYRQGFCDALPQDFQASCYSRMNQNS